MIKFIVFILFFFSLNSFAEEACNGWLRKISRIIRKTNDVKSAEKPKQNHPNIREHKFGSHRIAHKNEQEGIDYKPTNDGVYKAASIREQKKNPQKNVEEVFISMKMLEGMGEKIRKFHHLDQATYDLLIGKFDRVKSFQSSLLLPKYTVSVIGGENTGKTSFIHNLPLYAGYKQSYQGVLPKVGPDTSTERLNLYLNGATIDEYDLVDGAFKKTLEDLFQVPSQDVSSRSVPYIHENDGNLNLNSEEIVKAKSQATLGLTRVQGPMTNMIFVDTMPLKSAAHVPAQIDNTVEASDMIFLMVNPNSYTEQTEYLREMLEKFPNKKVAIVYSPNGQKDKEMNKRMLETIAKRVFGNMNESEFENVFNGMYIMSDDQKKLSPVSFSYKRQTQDGELVTRDIEKVNLPNDFKQKNNDPLGSKVDELKDKIANNVDGIEDIYKTLLIKKYSFSNVRELIDVIIQRRIADGMGFYDEELLAPRLLQTFYKENPEAEDFLGNMGMIMKAAISGKHNPLAKFVAKMVWVHSVHMVVEKKAGKNAANLIDNLRSYKERFNAAKKEVKQSKAELFEKWKKREPMDRILERGSQITIDYIFGGLGPALKDFNFKKDGDLSHSVDDIIKEFEAFGIQLSGTKAEKRKEIERLLREDLVRSHEDWIKMYKNELITDNGSEFHQQLEHVNNEYLGFLKDGHKMKLVYEEFAATTLGKVATNKALNWSKLAIGGSGVVYMVDAAAGGLPIMSGISSILDLTNYTFVSIPGLGEAGNTFAQGALTTGSMYGLSKVQEKIVARKQFEIFDVLFKEDISHIIDGLRSELQSYLEHSQFLTPDEVTILKTSIGNLRVLEDNFNDPKKYEEVKKLIEKNNLVTSVGYDTVSKASVISQMTRERLKLSVDENGEPLIVK